MNKVCNLYPKDEDKGLIFRELYNELGDRNIALNLWSKSLKEYKDVNTTQELLLKIGNIRDQLPKRVEAGYINLLEGLNKKSFKTYSKAKLESDRIESKHELVFTKIERNREGYTVKTVPVNGTTIHERGKTQSLEKLNQDILSYMKTLGFTAIETEDIPFDGVFDPANAEINAEGLKTAIRISKGESGKIALPEEFSHLLVLGYQENELMKRLMKAVSNTDGLVLEILGEKYEQYKTEYMAKLPDSYLEALVLEAVSRLVAQNLASSYQVPDSIYYISQRALNSIKNRLQDGSVVVVDLMLREANEIAKEFVKQFNDGTLDINIFNALFPDFKIPLLRLNDKVNNLTQLFEEAYKREAKRIKIKSLNDGLEATREDYEMWNKVSLAKKKLDYVQGIKYFIEYVKKDTTELRQQIENLANIHRNNNNIPLHAISNMSKYINDARNLKNTYGEVLKIMVSLKMFPELCEGLDEKEIEEIQDIATIAQGLLSQLDVVSDSITKDVLLKYFGKYWQGDKTYKDMNGVEHNLTLEGILNGSSNQVSYIQQLFGSMASMGDPYLQMIDVAFKDLMFQRNEAIQKLQQRLNAITKDYIDETGDRDLSFCYEMDENGQPTGMLKSDRDYDKFFKAKRAERERLKEALKDLKEKDLNLYYAEITRRLDIWIKQNTERTYYDVGDKKKMMKVPKKSIYASDALEKMSKALRKYYDSIIEIKKQMDLLIPQRYTSSIGALYRAPLVKKSAKLSILQGEGKNALKGIRDRFSIVNGVNGDQEDSLNYAQQAFLAVTEEGDIDLAGLGKEYTLTSVGNTEVRTVPVFYIQWLGKDMNMLNTNLTDAMTSYCSMALNFYYTNQIAEIMMLAEQFYDDREIVKTNKKNVLYNRFKMKNKNNESESFEDVVTKKGSETAGSKKIHNYIDSNIFNAKKVQEVFNMAGKEYNYGKIGDLLKQWMTHVGLGTNLFSGTTNLVMGIVLTFTETIGNSSDMKASNVLKAHKDYLENITQVIIERYSDVKQNKLSLLLDMFDPEGDYFNAHDSEFANNVVKKLIKNANPLFLNSMGEHYLHTISMISMLKGFMVYRRNANGLMELISLYDAILVKENKMPDGTVYYTLDYSNLYMDEKGKKRVDAHNMSIFKGRIDAVNNRMHGAFSDVDRGDIHRTVLGRLIMNFRQWMPEYYRNRWGEARFNVATQQYEEGFHKATLKFIFTLLGDLSHLKFNLATKWKEFTPTQRTMVLKSIAETTAYFALYFLLKSFHWKKDKDDDMSGTGIFFLYTLFRIKTEIGTAVPALSAVENIGTLFNSPIPAMNLLNKISDLLKFSDMNKTVSTGKYAGWNKYIKTLYELVPYVKNINRLIFMLFDKDTQMLNPYKE